MEFNHFLSSYLPDLAYGGKRLLDDMVEQAKLADRLGYRGVTIPEHHLINILLTPSPLQMAVKVAAETEHLELMTSVVVLPLDGGCNPRLNRFIADTLANGELVILDGLKHAILLEAPERVANHVRDFLLRHH